MITVRKFGIQRPPLWIPQNAKITPKRMGEASSFNWTEIPTSALIAGGGGLAAYLAGILPEVPKIIVRSAGFIVMGYAVYRLFMPSAAAETTATEAAQFKAAKTPPKEDFDRISARFTKPAPNSTVYTGLFSRDYDVTLIWFSGSQEKVTFSWDIIAEEKEISINPLALIPGGGQGGSMGPAYNQVVYNAQTSLAPNGDSGPLPIEIDLIRGKSATVAGWFVKLTARKIGLQGPIPVASVSFYVSP